MSLKVATYLNEPSVIYLSPEGDPLWFTVGKGADDLIPTVYTLWKKYDLLPWISTPAAVIPALVGGADLMIPGVIQISSSAISPPQLTSVVQRTDGPTSTCGPPLAVGWLAVDLNTLEAGAKGKAVQVLHTWKDHLFEMGSKGDPPGEIEIKANDEAIGDNETEEVDAQVAGEGLVPSVEGTDKYDKVTGAQANSAPASEPQEPSSSSHNSVAHEITLSKEEVSGILRTALLQSINTTLSSLPPASFPISASTFYSSYILPFRPAVVRKSSTELSQSSTSEASSSTYPQVDIKHSTHKSLLAFFKLLDKQQLLSLKDGKTEPLVTSVSASHPDVTSHRRYTSLRDVQAKEEKKEKREEEERARVKEMEVKELWKPHAFSGSAKFFTEGGFDSSAFYTYSDLKTAVNTYVAAHQLINARDQSYVNVGMDQVLLTTISAKGEAPEGLEFLKREEVVRRLSDKMQSWYEVRVEGRDPLLKKGQIKPISVIVKVRQGRKASTLVTGFEPFFLGGEEMAEELRRLCACATSASPAPGKTSGLEVLVQGRQIKAVTEFLLSRGIPKKWIEAADLTKK
ncbi:hypothetical protein PAXINDRAFT_167424 [Paxillus involutus ATCC 200175]|nr:hypothetical protein PAXINDRAFT_167424 [Paxillus involutus ATCC 200175]